MRLASALENFASENRGIPLAAARIEGGRCDTAYFFCGPETRFEIGSITRVITAILLTEAVVGGSCSLDDPLDRWLPRAPKWGGKRITLRHLVTHTSGLPRLPAGMFLEARFSKQPYARWDRERLGRGIAHAWIERAPGSTYAYSNFGFAVLGLALEAITGRRYEDLVSELTSRLGCPELRAPLPDDASVAAQGHGAKGKAVEAWNLAAFAPAGACTSTLEAMASFARRNLDPVGDPGLSLALEERHKYSTRFPPGSGWPRTALCAAVAGGLTWFVPSSYIVPFFSVELAALGGGLLGGGLTLGAWEGASFLTHAPSATMVGRLAYGSFAVGVPMLMTMGRKPFQEMGLGWHVIPSDAGDIVWHNGGTAGFRTFLGLQPATGKAIVMLSGQAKSVDALALRLL